MPKRLVLMFYLLSLITIIILYSFSRLKYSELLLQVTLGITLFTLLLFIFCKEKNPNIKKQYMRPIVLFLIGYIIVFFQLYIDLSLGYVSPDNSFLFVNPLVINQAALLSCGGLISFLIGYLLLNNRAVTLKKTFPPITYSLKWLNILLFILLIVFVYYNGEAYLSSSYSQEFLEKRFGSLAAYSEVIFFSVYLAILILNTKKNREKSIPSFKYFLKSFNWLFYLNMIIYALLVMISGDRGPILIILSTYLFSYIFITRKKIKMKYLIIGIFLGISLFSTLGYIRTIDSNEPLTTRISSALQKAELNNQIRDSFFPPTKELASSIRTFHHAINFVPDSHPYLFGSFQFRDILTAIPFSSSISNHFLDTHFKYKNSAYFITWIHQGNYYFYGDGSSINADLYLSFGFIGIFVGLFLLGLLFRFIDLTIFSASINRISLFHLTLAFVVFGTAIYMNRSSVFGQLYYLTFSFIIITIYDSIMKKVKKK